MIKVILCIIICNFIFYIPAQNFYKPSAFEIKKLPSWAQKMYDENPNVFEVDALYKKFYVNNDFEKNYHTQYYKKWKKRISNRIDEFGFIKNENLTQYRKPNPIINDKTTGWSLVGPIQNFQENGNPGSGQANIYCIDQCKIFPSVLYCGTESGEVYKSTNSGDDWFCVSLNEDFGGGVTAIEVNPNNQNTVFAGGNNGIFLSTNGALTWTNTLPSSNLGVNEIIFSSTNDLLVLAATDKGLFRSIDGGNTWIQLFNNKSYDIKENTSNSSILYLLKNNSNLNICEFYTSMDFGETWNIQNSGWYDSTDPARHDGGGRLAVTSADPNRIYAYLIGEAKEDDFGFIGVYKSTDGGNSWTLPNTPSGGPYSEQHPNLAIGSPDWTYHQGFYNCAIICSETNPDEVIAAGLNIWKSIDGASSFSSVSGYSGGPLNLHVDNQDFRSINGNYWWTTDGGIYHSTDLLSTQPEFKMRGVNSSDFWGFGSGWNEDVLVGGLYHNGNLAFHENYGSGNFLELGGGEAPTGYVNPGNNRKTYYSDISGKILPNHIDLPIESFGIGLSPNESYWASESSEMEFHPNCYNIIYLGKDNKFWKSSDGGASYNLIHEFGTNTNDQVKYIEISSSNENVIYVSQQFESGESGKLWKTIDAGQNWSLITIPNGNNRRLLITINPNNQNEIWMAYPDGSNGNKTYHSINGGDSWTNETTAILNDQSIQSIVYIAGTNGGIYAGTNLSIYYKNNSISWVMDNANLPQFMSTNILKPFYRDSKIRMASYGKGIWEGNLFENPTQSIARITVDKLKQDVYCEIDSFYFDDYSFLNHSNASWEWSFPTGLPTSSTLRNPRILFETEGIHLAILKITDQNGLIDYDSLTVELNFLDAPSVVEEGFENDFLPIAWSQKAEINAGSWSVSNNIGGYSNSSHAALFDNFSIDSQGKNSDLMVNMNLNGTADLFLKFDIAYAQYDQTYSDTLSVLISTDCGATFTSLYKKGGQTLSTAPSNQELFVPTSNQWRTDSLNISNYQGDIIVSFRNKGHFGNAIYLDNVNITNNLGTHIYTIQNELSVYPNPICAGEFLNLTSDFSDLNIEMKDQKGKIVLKSKGNNTNNLKIPTELKSGVYLLTIEEKNHIWNKKIVIN